MSADDEAETLRNERKRALRALLESPGWCILKKALEGQFEVRAQHIILTPLSETFTSSMQEFEKGEAAAMKFLLALPDSMLETLELDTDADTEQRTDLDTEQPDTGEQQLGPDGWAR